jgi:hypothetical protein
VSGSILQEIWSRLPESLLKDEVELGFLYMYSRKVDEARGSKAEVSN